MPYCENCGNKISETTKFCSHCGEKISLNIPKEPSDQNVNEIGIKTNSPTIIEKKSNSGTSLNQDSGSKELWNRIFLNKSIKELIDQYGNGSDWWDEPDKNNKFPEPVSELFKGFYFTSEEIEKLKVTISETLDIVSYENGDLYIGSVSNGNRKGMGSYLEFIDKSPLPESSADEARNLSTLLSVVTENNSGYQNCDYCLKYIGDWDNDSRSGFGIEINTTLGNVKFIGSWKEDKYCGQGTKYSFGKEKKVGEFKNGEADGFIVEYREDGRIEYEGYFNNDQRSGEGKEYFYNSSILTREGIWKEDEFIKGNQYYNNGQLRYSGEFENDWLKNGKLFSEAGKIKYDGNFLGYVEDSEDLEDKPHGFCIMYDEKGNVEYEGNWEFGLYHGYGKLFYENGDSYEGDFVKGKFMGNCKYSWADGNVYEGDVVNNQFTGKGKFLYNDGTVYEGDVVNGQITGKGKLWDADGVYYEGEFIDGKTVGDGTFFSKDGQILGTSKHGRVNVKFINMTRFMFKSLGSKKMLTTPGGVDPSLIKNKNGNSMQENQSKKNSSNIKPKDGAGIR